MGRLAPFAGLLAALAGFGGAREAAAQAFPINSDVALQPAEGQLLYRTQLRFRDFEIENLDTTDRDDIDGEVRRMSHVLVYGWTSRFSTLVGVPLFDRDLDSLMGEDDDEEGIGDVTLLFRYKLWQKLGHLKSQTWTAIAGVEIPTYDDPFSSRSFDPIVGSVYSWRSGRHGFDADILHRFNTENDRDFEAGDLLRYDLAYQYRLWPDRYTAETEWSLTGLLELNGAYHGESELDGRTLDETDGHQVFLSPGLVLAGKRARYEAGFQFPIVQNVGDRAAEDNVRFVIGATWAF